MEQETVTPQKHSPKLRPRTYFVRIVIALVVLGLGGWYVLWEWEKSINGEPNYSQMEERLYVGGHVKEPPAKTDFVLNLSLTIDPYRSRVTYADYPIRDGAPAPSLAWLKEVIARLEAALSDGKTVYVHCRNGVSRTGMVIVAYYVKKNRWTVNKALAHVRKKRPIIRPNPAFAELLIQWEKEHRK